MVLFDRSGATLTFPLAISVIPTVTKVAGGNELKLAGNRTFTFSRAIYVSCFERLA